MARNIITNVTIVDDFDGATPAETIPFTFGGSSYTVDLGPLNAANFNKMREAHERKIAALNEEFEAKMDKFVKVAKRTGRASLGERDYDPAQVREWAAQNGHDVPARGRISNDVIHAYRAANIVR